MLLQVIFHHTFFDTEFKLGHAMGLVQAQAKRMRKGLVFYIHQ